MKLHLLGEVEISFFSLFFCFSLSYACYILVMCLLYLGNMLVIFSWSYACYLMINEWEDMIDFVESLMNILFECRHCLYMYDYVAVIVV